MSYGVRWLLDMISGRAASEKISKLPEARLVSRDWKPSPSKIPCCEECRAFGPCAECVQARALDSFARLNRGDPPPTIVCKNGHRMTSGAWCLECTPERRCSSRVHTAFPGYSCDCGGFDPKCRERDTCRHGADHCNVCDW